MSQGGGRDKKHSTHTIPFHLHSGSFGFRDKLATFDLELPADIGEKNLPTVCFDIRDKDEAYSLKLMKILTHSNILHVWALKESEDKSFVAAYVDHFTGVLSDLLTPYSQIVDGLDYLRANGYYHGNLSLETIRYHKGSSGYTIKLCHFEEKDSKKLLEWQKDDWVSLGELLEVISDIARSKPNTQFFFCLIEDLSRKLKSFSFSSLETIRDEVKGHPFFWDSCRRKHFFVSEVPVALSNKKFTAKIGNLTITLPWNSDYYDGYLIDMDKYRAKMGYNPYKVRNKVHYVQCMSGLYTHETELNSKGPSVDAAIQRRNPKLCLDLKNAMSSA